MASSQPNSRGRLPAAWPVVLVALAALIGAFTVVSASRPLGDARPSAAAMPTIAAVTPSPAERRALASAVADLVTTGSGEVPDAHLRAWLPADARGVAYVALRAAGERLSDAWSEATAPEEALRAGVLEARAALSADELRDIDAVEVVIVGPDAGDAGRDGSAADNLDRGILGIRIDHAGDPIHVAPTRMIADNTSFERVIQRLREGGIEPIGATLFEATQFLFDLENLDVHRLTRGADVVGADSVTSDAAGKLADGMADWLFAQLGDDGRMVYEYFPSRGEEADSNNMIRQWMATVAMTRLALAAQDPDLLARVAVNIDFNLSISYSEEDGLGLIADPDGDVKLGAVALAALAISQHPDRDRWQEQEAALRRTVDHLWHPDGAFRTFYRPADRNDNQNFYPGEALLLWATTLEGDPENAALLDRFMASFRHYREWHRAQPNPAFVPWHTMAYEIVWGLTRDAELRDFVFEMNDWLLPMQQWDSAPAPDVAGRFYNPQRPDYGPPHASSDGVYLEGLVAAYRLAIEADDAGRAEAYRTTVARGLRNLLQLQFADDLDMFYISQRDRVAGGMRTTVYDNRIRVDNVQHGLMAVLDMLEVFGPDDFRPAPP